MTPTPTHQAPPQRSTLLAVVSTALGAVALVVLIARTIPTAAEHRGQIQAVGDHVTTCSVLAERGDDSGIQTLAHIADCVQDNHQIRSEAGDVTLTMVVLTLVGCGGWQFIHSWQARGADRAKRPRRHP